MNTPNISEQIMNLPVLFTEDVVENATRAYTQGHKEARHAAAELVLPLQERVKQLEEALLTVLKSMRDTADALGGFRPGSTSQCIYNKAQATLDDK